MNWMYFKGRLFALCGDTSAWASVQAMKRREEKDGSSDGLSSASSQTELDAQWRKAAMTLEAFSGSTS